MVGRSTAPIMGTLGYGGKLLGHLPGTPGVMANAFGDKALEAAVAGHRMTAPDVLGGQVGENPLENYFKGEAAQMRATGNPWMANVTQFGGQGGMRGLELLVPGYAGGGLIRGVNTARALRAAGPAAQAARTAATAAPAAAAPTATGAGAVAPAAAAMAANAARGFWPSFRSALGTGAGWTAGGYGLEALKEKFFPSDPSSLTGEAMGATGNAGLMSHPGTWMGLLGLLALLGGGGGLGGLLPLLLLGGGRLLASHSGMLDQGKRLAEPNLHNVDQYLAAARAGDPGAQTALARIQGRRDYGALGEMLAPAYARYKQMTDPEGFAQQFAAQ
jgi:hypothetical protein